MLEVRREVETLHSAVEELKGSILRLMITQGVHRFVKAVSILTESSEFLGLGCNVRMLSRTVDELKGAIKVAHRQQFL